MVFVQLWRISHSWALTLLLAAQVPGVLCAYPSDIGGLVAAAGVAFFLLFAVIAMIVVGFTWNSWYQKMQWARGRVKMPRAYWKKKEETRLKLLNTSYLTASESGMPNANNASKVQDTASWIQGWNNANLTNGKMYEEMGLAMELGAEDKDEEFRIETTVVDDEALDLGPFQDSSQTAACTSTGKRPDKSPAGTDANNVMAAKSASKAASTAGGKTAGKRQASQQPQEMTETPPDAAEDYLYSTVDRSNKVGPGGDTEDAGDGPTTETERVTAFPKSKPYLVAL